MELKLLGVIATLRPNITFNRTAYGIEIALLRHILR